MEGNEGLYEGTILRPIWRYAIKRDTLKYKKILLLEYKNKLAVDKMVCLLKLTLQRNKIFIPSVVNFEKIKFVLELANLGRVLLGLFRNRNSWNKPNNCSLSGYSHFRVAVKPS